jgi:hypothetical protein
VTEEKRGLYISGTHGIVMVDGATSRHPCRRRVHDSCWGIKIALFKQLLQRVKGRRKSTLSGSHVSG